jgi:phosphate starvation-inducible membrane PsiE
MAPRPTTCWQRSQTINPCTHLHHLVLLGLIILLLILSLMAPNQTFPRNGTTRRCQSRSRTVKYMCDVKHILGFFVVVALDGMVVIVTSGSLEFQVIVMVFLKIPLD